MIIRSPAAEEIGTLIKMLTRAYVSNRSGFPDDPSLLAAYSAHDPNSGPENWVVLWDDDRPLSALRLFIRDAMSPAGPMKIGGIGNVGTDPEYGGRGLATHVMNAAHERLRDLRIETALLVTDIPDFYARFGYQVVRQRELLGTCGPVRPRGEIHGDILELTPPIPDPVRAWHAAGLAASSGRLIRSQTYWDSWIGRFKLRRPEVEGFVTDASYVIGRREEDGAAFRVLEGGGAEADLTPLVTRIATGVTKLKTPDEPLFRNLTADVCGDVVQRVRTGIMACAVETGALGPEAFEGSLELDAF